jgi:hypothetical protein
MKTLVTTGFLAVIFIAFICCTANLTNAFEENENHLINAKGADIRSRFNTLTGFVRISAKAGSFAEYLQTLPLKEAGSKVKYYDGSFKHKDVYEAVVDLDVGNKNLQQCADAIIRLRAEYFYAMKAYDKISFNLTNGFRVDYSAWIKGYRVKVNGNHTYWQKSAAPSNTYKDLRNYLNFVFAYAGTLSLSRTLYNKDLRSILIGDVFIIGGSPGHAVIVVDMAENKTGEKMFLLAQSYMPAQEIQILKNPNNSKISPWYSADIKEELITPEWSFKANQLKAWDKN